MRKRLAIVIGVAAVGAMVLSGTTSATERSDETMSRAEVERALIGTWRLSSAEIRDPGGNLVASAYEDPVGKLTYTRRGDMWVVFGERHSTNPSDTVWYTGSFDVRARAQEVVHHVEYSSFTPYVGTDQVRHYNVRPKRLVLRVPTGPNPLYFDWARVR